MNTTNCVWPLLVTTISIAVMENGYPAQCTSFFLENALKFIPLYNYTCNSIVIRLGMYLDLYLTLYLELKKKSARWTHDLLKNQSWHFWDIHCILLKNKYPFFVSRLCTSRIMWKRPQVAIFMLACLFLKHNLTALPFLPKHLEKCFFLIWRFLFHIHNLTTLTVLPKLF